MIGSFIIFKNKPSHLTSLIRKTESMVKLQAGISSTVSIHFLIVEVFASHILVLTCAIAIEIDVVDSFSIAFWIVVHISLRPVVIQISSEARSWRIRILRTPFPILTDCSFPHVFLTNALPVLVSVFVIVVTVDCSWMKISLFVWSGKAGKK